MNYKYSCPYCGQHIEYTDGYSGRQMPCPMCQHAITFPVVMPGKMTSSLRLVRDIPKPVQKFEFSLAGVVQFLREFQHWKVVGLCMVPFVILAGALVAASALRHQDPAPSAPTARVSVDPHALDRATDLTRADMVAQQCVQDCNQAASACQTAAKNHASAADLKIAQKAKEDARKKFDAAFSTYRELGGTIDYRRQVQ